MLSLKVSLPVRTITIGKPSRLVYRVLREGAKPVTLPALAQALGVPYPSLWWLVQSRFKVPGVYTHEFHRVIRDVKAGHEKRPATTKCPTCKGRGRVPANAST